MGNFSFLANNNEFKAFSVACIDAENSIKASPALCALATRKGVELAVKWLYSVDNNLKLPYNGNLSALVLSQSFAENIDKAIIDKLRFIIKLGNNAAHTSKSITRNEATLALRALFDFVYFIDYCYGSNYEERVFNEAILPKADESSLSKAEFNKLAKAIEDSTSEKEKLLKELSELKNELNSLRGQNEATRKYSPSSDISEFETRKRYIDVDLKAMGWTIGVDCIEEYPVEHMVSTPSGTGKVDYVLLDDNGKPLALIEAKKTSRSPKEGKTQAEEYADCLEKMKGQRPLIFYTNGFDTWFWDDESYPTREVFSVFSKEELQKLMKRKSQKKSIETPTINPKITDRPYQLMAIKRVCEEFTNGRRKALLVMATGSGKTRTAASLVDVLSKNDWITNVLFLADRKELVKQAKEAFNEHLINLSTCNLLKREKGTSPEDRAIFSTYPTIMNAINEEKTKDGKKLYTPAHFDLIIIDEAHRSIFKKYRAIFEYFDALIVGLTATPREEVDRNTYDFFDLPNNEPTSAFTYEQALEVPYLANYHCIEKIYKIPFDGIYYDDLSAEEKEALEDVFEEDEEVPDHISGDDVNRIFFNIDTTKRILQDVMKNGIKVEGEDKLGKTIIFARNHDHAVFIEEQFDLLYPKLKGKFARVIDNKEKKAEQLLKDFKNKDLYPQIAISVDMLDTGIDVPEIVNLVYFKRVMSKTKFWQMFGRGTRLCKDLFGPGKDKTEFRIFDYLGNFEFFRQNPKGKEAEEVESLSEKMFKYKIRIIKELQELKYQTADLIPFRQSLMDDVLKSINDIDMNHFAAQQKRREIEKYKNPASFVCIKELEKDEICNSLAGLIPVSEDNEKAKQFDVLLYKLEFAVAGEDESVKKSCIKKIKALAKLLESKGTIDEVKAAGKIIMKVQTTEFWDTATIPEIDKVRKELRDLIQYLKTEFKQKIINIEDTLLSEKEGERFTEDTTLDPYYNRAMRYISEHKDDIAIYKLSNNMELNENDWNDLENILWHEVGTKQEYNEILTDDKLGLLVRSITGISREAAEKAFSEFLSDNTLNEAQMNFVKKIIDYVVAQGHMTRETLKEDSFSVMGSISDLFKDKTSKFKEIINTIDDINNRAVKAAS